VKNIFVMIPKWERRGLTLIVKRFNAEVAEWQRNPTLAKPARVGHPWRV
jgi:hypothetical protein